MAEMTGGGAAWPCCPARDGPLSAVGQLPISAHRKNRALLTKYTYMKDVLERVRVHNFLTESIRYRPVQAHSCPGQGKNKASGGRTGEEANPLHSPNLFSTRLYVADLLPLQVTRKCACVTIRDHVCGCANVFACLL
jgi:hypothetical protein